MAGVELRGLQGFLAVADHRHFGRAARQLGLSQPSLSAQVKVLEQALGVRLFDRSTRHVRLTAAGEALLPGARATVVTVDQACTAAQRAGRGETGGLEVGFVGSAVLGVLPRVLRAFTDRYPEVALQLHELTTADQARRLLEGRLDVGFVRPPLTGDAEERLDVVAVSREPVVAVLPSGHRLAGDGPLDAALLAGERFVMFPRQRGPGLFDRLRGVCVRAGFDPRIAHEAVQLTTIVGLVAGGLGVSVLPGSITRSPRRDVVFRPITPTEMIVDLALVGRHDDPNPLVANFRALTTDLTVAGGLRRAEPRTAGRDAPREARPEQPGPYAVPDAPTDRHSAGSARTGDHV